MCFAVFRFSRNAERPFRGKLNSQIWKVFTLLPTLSSREGVVSPNRRKFRQAWFQVLQAGTILVLITLAFLQGAIARTGSGVELAGALPTEYQDHIVLVAGLSANAPEAKAGQALIHYLVSSDAEAALKAKGYEPIMK